MRTLLFICNLISQQIENCNCIRTAMTKWNLNNGIGETIKYTRAIKTGRGRFSFSFRRICLLFPSFRKLNAVRPNRTRTKITIASSSNRLMYVPRLSVYLSSFVLVVFVIWLECLDSQLCWVSALQDLIALNSLYFMWEAWLRAHALILVHFTQSHIELHGQRRNSIFHWNCLFVGAIRRTKLTRAEVK